MSNSVKFTPPGGSISLEVAPASDAVVIRVVDSGDGVDPSVVDRIFEPWERGGRTVGDGVGLGLAITRHIVELHHGSIRARSAGKGQGTEFEIRLPRVDD